MELRRLPAEEAAVRRFVEELWLPYNRELKAVVDGFALAGDVDVVDEEVSHRLDRLAADDFRAWVAVEEGDDAVEGRDDIDLAATDRALAGFVTTEVDESPPIFDRPDRFVVCDLYVRERHRGWPAGWSTAPPRTPGRRAAPSWPSTWTSTTSGQSPSTRSSGSRRGGGG